MATQMTLYCFIKLDKGIYAQVKVEATTTVDDILDKIYADQKHVFDRHFLAKGDLELYVVDAEEAVLERTLTEGLPRLTLWQTVQQAFELREGEGGLDNRLLIVVPDSTVEARRPITPENNYRGHAPQSWEETQKLVDDFLRSHDTRLVQFLDGPPWNDFWKAPSSAHHETATFIDNLNIPHVFGDPMLLLHALGDGIVDEDVIKEVFTNQSRFLVNTSGSGKTRLLFEGLIKHWGFYFTSVTDKKYSLGSTDMMDAIVNAIPKSHGWIPAPDKADDVVGGYQTNYSIAKRRVHQVLTARVLVFERFLTLTRATRPTHPINKFREHWLFLQLYPSLICDTDVFDKLSKILKDANEMYLMMHSFSMVHDRLVELQKQFDLEKDFYLILDEAQEATENLTGCFRSEFDLSVKRPVLKPIVDCWAAAARCPIILSGTGLSMEVVNETLCSSVVKIAPFSLATKTCAFDDRERQRKYITRYMPGHIAASESGEELLGRAWQYVRGRHRFTATMLVELIRNSFASPHRVLNKYVSTVSKFTATDGQRLPEGEEEVIMTNVLPLSFIKIIQDSERKLLLSDLIFTWLLTQRLVTLVDKYEDLVQLGVARFVESPSPKARVDEPLVLLAATHALSNANGFTLQDHVISPMHFPDSQAFRFERLVAYYLASAFDGKRELHEIFDFRENVPQWAKQPAEVVSFDWSIDEQLRFNPFHLPKELGSSTKIGFKSGGMDQTADWFGNPSSLLCFPDPQMGPDIVLFIRLKDSDKVLVAVVQCNWKNLKILPKSVVIQAAESLNPSKFFGDSTSRTSNAGTASTSVFNVFNRLDGPESDNWFQHGVPMLKVIASYPAVAQKHFPADCTTLNMDPYVHLIDTTGVMKAVAEKLTGDKRPATPDDGSTSNKRPRT